MPLQDHMKLISVDDHLVEHPRVWEDRLPARFRDAGPRVVETESSFALGGEIGGNLGATSKGAQVWMYEGRVYPQLGLNAVAGRDPKDYGLEPVRYDEMIPGCYDPVERVKDMDLDGVQAAMCFPSFPRFSGTVFLEGHDKELALLCVQAFNDFVLDEWCAGAPDRFVPVVILPFWDVDATVAEIHRTAAKGALAISFPENPVPLGLPSFHTDHWDRVFSVVEETGMPLALHFGSSGKPPITAPDAPMAVMIALMGTNSMDATCDLLFSPVFHRHPRLKVMLSEGGIGWVPYLLERCDYTWSRHRWYQNIDKDMPPSDLFRRHIFACFIDDDTGIDLRHRIGISNITWECDYPHSDSNWPNSRKRAAQMLKGVPDEEAHQIVELNARRVLRFDADLRTQ
jgi:predicted TIM-barrel fold metal-dependent hydrolase